MFLQESIFLMNYKEINNPLVGEGGQSALSRGIYSPDF